MNVKNISFKALSTKALLAIAPFISQLMSGIVAFFVMVYKLLRYCLKNLWFALVTLLVIIPYGIYRLSQQKKS